MSQFETDKIEPTQVEKVQRNINLAVEQLVKWLIQEINSPEILPFQSQLIDGTNQISGLKELIEKQQNGLEQMRQESSNQKNSNKQKDYQFLMLHLIELERIKFIYSEYLRVRLKKISSQTFFIYVNANEGFLSHAEKEFYDALIKLKKWKFDQLLLNKQQKNYRSCGLEQRDKHQDEDNIREKIGKNCEFFLKYQLDVPSPNLYLWVFGQPISGFKDIKGEKVSEDDTILTCYNDIRRYALKMEIELK